MKSSNQKPSIGFSMSLRKTRKAIFLDQMGQVVQWSRLIDLFARFYMAGLTGRPAFELKAMLPTPFMRQWFNLSDLTMEEAFFDNFLYQKFVGLSNNVCLRDADLGFYQRTILWFCHRLEKKLADHILAEAHTVLGVRGPLVKKGSVVDGTLSATPSSTKNKEKAIDPEFHPCQRVISVLWDVGPSGASRVVEYSEYAF